MGLLSLKLKHSKWVLRSHGLEPKLVELENGSSVHCWVPVNKTKHGHRRSKVRGLEHDDGGTSMGEHADDQGGSEKGDESKMALLLVHGFGINGTLSWDAQVAALAKDFRLFIPDLICFGKSTTSNKRRSELFQAECMLGMMQRLGVRQAAVAGHSYGGFVAFSMAHLFPDFVTRLIIISSGIMMGPSTNDPLLREFGATEIGEVLMPQSISDTKRGLKLVYNKLPSWLPTCIFKEMFKFTNSNRLERLEIIDGIVLGKEGAPPVPKVHQDVLIIWGDQDKIFKLELGYQLKEFLGQKAELVILKGVGHLPHVEKAKTVNTLIAQFLHLQVQ